MSFMIHKVDSGQVPGIEYLPCGAITPKIGMALVQSGGNLAIATGTTAPTYISIVYQLTRDLTPEQIQEAGFDDYFVDHTTGVYPQAASGTPFSAATISVTGDTIADLHEDLSAEQKARMTYDNILRFTDDPDVKDPIRFLRAREVVHFQRFGEGLRILTDKLDSKNFYAFNPSYDKP